LLTALVEHKKSEKQSTSVNEQCMMGRICETGEFLAWNASVQVWRMMKMVISKYVKLYYSEPRVCHTHQHYYCWWRWGTSTYEMEWKLRRLVERV